MLNHSAAAFDTAAAAAAPVAAAGVLHLLAGLPSAVHVGPGGLLLLAEPLGECGGPLHCGCP